MNRRFMPADHGMLFEFEREAPEAFWMKNTYIPLDMIFISPTGVVTNIVANAEPLSERAIPSGPPCVAVLELNGGAAAAIGLKVGDTVRHPFSSPDEKRRAIAPGASPALHPPSGLLHSTLGPLANSSGRGRGLGFVRSLT